jgi:spermidine synthase
MTDRRTPLKPKETTVLVLSIFIAGLCSLVYELLIGTASSYFLGDSVRQFSITIGLYMAAMGAGSLISRLIQQRLLSKFIAVEILLGFLGGISVPFLYLLYATTNLYSVGMVVMILVIGVLIGLEIPLLTRILDAYYNLKINISNVLSLDYLGALTATLLFPFLFLPFWGTFKTSLFFGLVNMSIGFMNLWCFRSQLAVSRRRFYTIASTSVCLFLGAMFIFSHSLLKHWSGSLYQDRVILTRQTPYQRLVLTKYKEDLRLFIDGNLQFSSTDEYRYHEALAHVPLGMAGHRRRVLILGGGDGLLAREVLKHDDVARIVVVDLDPEVVRIARQNPYLVALNGGSLEDPRVRIVHTDAMKFLESGTDRFDVILGDLPDPNNASLARLYSREFYRLVARRLAGDGVFATQATSVFFARRAFWCINATLQAAGLKTRPYHVNVPSFGEWGFVAAAAFNLDRQPVRLEVPTRYLDDRTIAAMFDFPRDLTPVPVEVATLDRPAVLDYYIAGWKYWD